MKNFSLAGLLLTATMAASAAELPSLDATVTYDSKFVSHAGVTETRQFTNILIRRPGHVWMERVLPAQAQEHADEHGGHKHFDFETSTQHLTRTATGAIRAEYVDRGKRRVVFVPPTEYSVSGFDGSWDNAAAMVSEKTVKAMPLTKRVTTVADTEWREESRNGWYNRVLWSNRQKIALVVESGKTDGSTTRRTVLQLRPATADAALPWTQLGTYAQMEYDDFMD
jgi:hypothetical protein